jgi:hypothetical protein
MRPELSNLDEKLFFGLRGIELEREWVAAEVVQRVAKPRCPRRVDRKHIHPLGVPAGQIECLRLKPTTYGGGRGAQVKRLS